MDKKAIEMKNITKKFGDFTANDNIDLTVHKGEIHALLGENGAGKSTLMNVLYGLYTPTSGDIYIDGKKVSITNPNVAIKNGIGMVHQHFMLVDTFTVVENIILGMETTNGAVLDIKKATKNVEEISKKYGLLVDPHAKIQDISVGMQQRVEILKALYRGADILILDEPTAVLTPQEIDELINIIHSLANQGKTIIIITHKLKEIKAVADYCTIIRRGKRIDTVKVEDVNEENLAEMMVGREVSFVTDKKPVNRGKKILDINDILIKDNRKLNAVNGLSLELHSGEILGIAGVDGNGQSELIEGITGLRNIESGNVILDEKDITNKTPFEIINSGLSNIPEDRQKRGLVLDFTIAENMILENYHKEPFSKKGRLNHRAIENFSKELIEKFDVRPNNPSQRAGALSGGNQQKVIIAREVTNNPEVLIAAQPTRGLDVGAIEYVHRYLIEQRDNGKAVLLISFELEEIINLSDRIAVIYEGKIVDIIDSKDADERKLGLLMAGGGADNEKK
ncbi:ABC transporter ATP-binding protein [Tissierella sp. MB52-C2]|uniref:ABC transporter ATP-binding protein n=1 Tax=Tissierella sp. MB52-C2 TaxID=3070999 RepID=UPI00280BDB68|nr:ABC transporter ATP-binding protein [Tissierella sp. MB52-C2]WMM26961.1 ABC transporter ATP-binding protein [Tissierella sp. MB52-C2]